MDEAKRIIDEQLAVYQRSPGDVIAQAEEDARATTEDERMVQIIATLDQAHCRAVSDFRICDELLQTTQDLKALVGKTEDALKQALKDVVVLRCMNVEREYDERVSAAATDAQIAQLKREKAGKVNELLGKADLGTYDTLPHDQDAYFLEKSIAQLKAWTGRHRARTLYDSTADPFTDDGLFAKVKNRANVAVIGFTTDGDVFGGFYSAAVREQKQYSFDPEIFVFSFEARGRCETPQRFDVNERLRGKVYVYFYKDNAFGFVTFWASTFGGMTLGNDKSQSICFNTSKVFNTIKDTVLTGRNNERHACARLVAVQLL